ncbi:unnamed protein product [Candida verbasci]|uniref:Chloride channel protein n=1 Tax=Candida verbasci TaxID=1227364 RepID=A0A9W4XJ43_9ASCO|nr:unnamed protein product [Candida verbasci]
MKPDENDHLLNHLNIPVNQNRLHPSRTVPTTPLAYNNYHAQGNYNSVQFKPTPIPLKKIKSLGKLDVKSPILKSSILLSPNVDYFNYKNNNSDAYSLKSNADSIKSKFLNFINDKVILESTSFYNDFTTIDWTNAYLNSNKFNYDLKDGDNKVPLYGRVYYLLGKYLCLILIGVSFALLAYLIDKFEILLINLKFGYCKSNFFASEITCCNEDFNGDGVCPHWVSWSIYFHQQSPYFNYFLYTFLTITFACISCLITLTTKIIHKSRTIYTASGSGVPEVKTILSGFIIRKFLGFYTLISKTIALILAIASGLSLGKEGPYVHLATCLGNIIIRWFPFIYNNDLFTKQILSASASSGVTLAFGSPLGGILFILEEINNYLPSSQLFQIFFCTIISTLFLKILNPYNTGKIVLFELSYDPNLSWKFYELIFFVIIGISGGIFGSSFVKFVKWKKKLTTSSFLFDVLLIGAITGLITFWNPYLKQANTELILDLATSCSEELDHSLCPRTDLQYLKELKSLVFAFIIKVFLTFITFGLKIPHGIYIPSMVIGALFGRIISMFFNYFFNFNLDFGIYAIISAGSFMAGITHMNITLVTILFELTSSYNFILPISISISIANWIGTIIEKNSLYEMILETNDYPFMNELETETINPIIRISDLINDFGFFIDITKNKTISFDKLNKIIQSKNDNEERAKSIDDFYIPILKEDTFYGLIYFLDLEIYLDRVNEFMIGKDLCQDIKSIHFNLEEIISSNLNENIINNLDTSDIDLFKSLVDLSFIINKSPIFLNYDSELSLANLIFDKIGCKVIVILKEGKFYNLLHKKRLIDYLRKENS